MESDDNCSCKINVLRIAGDVLASEVMQFRIGNVTFNSPEVVESALAVRVKSVYDETFIDTICRVFDFI